MGHTEEDQKQKTLYIKLGKGQMDLMDQYAELSGLSKAQIAKQAIHRLMAETTESGVLQVRMFLHFPVPPNQGKISGLKKD